MLIIKRNNIGNKVTFWNNNNMFGNILGKDMVSYDKMKKIIISTNKFVT